MKNVIKLTKFSWDKAPNPILIGTESIIQAKEETIKHYDGRTAVVTKIESRGAMVSVAYVLESVEEIYQIINS